jgi:orotidine-5'-phosphate decarboxylase
MELIVALDGLTKEKSLEIASRLSGLVWGFKVNDLLLEEGFSIIRELKKFGKVFADPKLHDIPNTVKNCVKKLAETGVSLITVHASGGARMIEEAVKHSGSAEILSVTVLTSFSREETRSVYGISETEKKVLELAKLAEESGTHGIVCSPQELPILTKEIKRAFFLTPGIRLEKSNDDQVRVMTPIEAKNLGAKYIVVGRPITESSDPHLVTSQIINSIS